MPLCSNCKTVFARLTEDGPTSPCPSCGATYFPYTNSFSTPSSLFQQKSTLQVRRLQSKRTRWSDEELTEALKTRILKKFFTGDKCNFCNSQENIECKAEKTIKNTIAFSLKMCCIDLEVAVDEMISEAKERLILLKQLEQGELNSDESS